MLQKYTEASYFHLFEKGHTQALLHFLFTAFTDDVRVIYFFLAQRLVFAKNYQQMSPELTVRVGKELIEIAAPLAHRMGIHSLKETFENLSFQILFPEDYAYIQKEEDEYTESKKDFFANMTQSFESLLAENAMRAKMFYRIKNKYSIFKKMQAKGTTKISDIYDVFAIRIVTDTIEECYKIFGILHANYRHIPGKIKDYISLSKPNGYQSLHTILFLPVEDDGHLPLEIQIRTKKMHAIAEEGVASHLLYKTSGSSTHQGVTKDQVQEKLTAIKSHFSEETFLKSTGRDLFASRIFVFTKDGEIKSFPSGATVIDFAYALHSDIGDCLLGAIINGNECSVYDPLRHFDTIEVFTSRSTQVLDEWEHSAKTPLAQKCIRIALRKKEELKLHTAEKEKNIYGFSAKTGE